MSRHENCFAQKNTFSSNLYGGKENMTVKSINHKKLPLMSGLGIFLKAALALAIPIALQNMLTASFSLIDTIMVGQLGEIALSSVGMAGQWSWLLNMVLFGLNSGASVFVSQYWGNKNIGGIHKVVGISAVIGAILSMLFMLVAFFFPEAIISIFNKDPDVIASGAVYLRYACFSYPAAALTTVFCVILRSAERPWLPMIVSGITTVLNAAMNYIFIFPAGLGVKGAALATCISAWLGLVLIVVISLIKKNILIAPPRALFGVSRAFLGEFFKKTYPVIINETLWGLGTVLYNIIFSNLGYEQYAAVTIVKTFENIVFCFFIGLCNACCVMVGKSVGSGQIREAIRDSKRFNILMPIMALMLGAAVIIFRAPLVSLFNLGQQVSGETLEIAQNILIIYGAWAAVRNISYLLVVGVFRSGGDTATGMKWEIIILWLFALPITFITAYVLKAPFLVIYITMYLCEDIPKSIIFLIHYFKGKWLKPVTDEGILGLREFCDN